MASHAEKHLFPKFGKKRVDQVGSARVVEALAPIWLEIPETACPILQRISVVPDFVPVKGRVLVV